MKTNFNKACATLQAKGKVWIKTTQVQNFLDHIQREFGLNAIRGEFSLNGDKRKLYV